MIVPSRAARRYAKALFDLALETGQMDAVKDDLSSLQVLSLESREFERFLGDYRLPRPIREKLLTDMLAGRLQALSLRFLTFLESKRRLGLLGQICGAFMSLHDRMNGIVRGQLMSAFDLAGTDVAAISGRVEATLEGHLLLNVAVDSDLLGGFRLRIGDVIHDFSVAGQLRRMKQRLVYG